MKGNTTHNNIRLWNVANLALFICAVFCLRYYIINTTDSSVICLIMNLTIVISIIGLIAYLVDGYTRPQNTITAPPSININSIQLLLNLSVRMTPNLSDKLRRKTDAGKRSNGLKLRLILKRPSIRYLLRLKLRFCSIII